MTEEAKFHYLTRAIIIQDGHVLLAHEIGAENTFLLGGHIELGEKAEDALVREIKEETGLDAKVGRFIGAVESSWVYSEEPNFEINLVFEATILNMDVSKPIPSKEAHLEFLWADLNELGKHNILPKPMSDCIGSVKDACGFWASNMDDMTNGGGGGD